MAWEPGDLPFEIEVFSKAFARPAIVADPESLSATIRHNVVSAHTFSVPFAHPAYPPLMADGARVVTQLKGGHLSSGLVVDKQADGDTAMGTFTVMDDFALLMQMLGWPNPAGTIDQQGAESAYFTRKGPAETVVKAIVAANATRLGIPLTVAPDQGRGGVIEVSTRMHPLTDRLFPLVDQAGIGLTVRQVGTGWMLDCYATRVVPTVITAASGILASWKLSVQAPTATRVVMMGQGEKLARSFRQRVDAATEAAWGMVAEVARDARDVADDDPNWAAVMDARADETLAEGAAKRGLSVELAETGLFSYGRLFGVGDTVTIAPPGTSISAVVREVAINYTRSDGLLVTPSVGDEQDALQVMAQAIAANARAVRDINARS